MRGGADDVRGRTWHGRQDLEDRKDGGLVVKMTLNNLEEIERWVLGFGEHVTVVGPQVLKARVAQTVKRIQQKYSTANGHE